jgi:hypothetical protein
MMQTKMQDTMSKTIAHKDPKLPPALSIPPGPEWVNMLQTLNGADAETLVAVVQTLYPHNGVPVTLYRRVICHLDRLATTMPDAALTLEKFCKLLAQSWPIPFPELAGTYQIQTLQNLELTPEFFFVQRMAVRYFYDNVEIWAAFGYEGASVHLGGYIDRGFDDLAWLPPLPDDI